MSAGLCVIPFGIGLLSICDYNDYTGSQQDLRGNFWIKRRVEEVRIFSILDWDLRLACWGKSTSNGAPPTTGVGAEYERRTPSYKMTGLTKKRSLDRAKTSFNSSSFLVKVSHQGTKAEKEELYNQTV